MGKGNINDQSTLEENVARYLKDHRQCVIGTSLNGTPFVAKVYYYYISNYELVFSTFPHLNKFKNLLKNPEIAIFIDDGSPANCLHYQGTAELITSQEEIDKLREYILTQDPPFRKFMKRSDIKFFKVKPHTIYYTDYQKKLFYRDVLKFDNNIHITEVNNERIF